MNFNEKTNNILKLVKAKFNLRNRSEAVNFLIKWYEEKILKEK